MHRKQLSFVYIYINDTNGNLTEIRSRQLMSYILREILKRLKMYKLYVYVCLCVCHMICIRFVYINYILLSF